MKMNQQMNGWRHSWNHQKDKDAKPNAPEPTLEPWLQQLLTRRLACCPTQHRVGPSDYLRGWRGVGLVWYGSCNCGSRVGMGALVLVGLPAGVGY